ncbi:polysaccharide deacetylase family protein [Clostridium tagluense]|uniref:polysaccharide deacetylase family protein n=1 Tax=Clostridium tagluense TaxID=360422 RepID=UPI001CF47E4B|nr:polysaccharide deacetylase family protein [Clostridium tagluense]MCB2309728.1 polysaccharide deacetylase family protein [Clostridium tagluense]MCB2314742.1 polysaccharide deacetylase family protein [Clostridium tagluense]MCB2319591.1 polysaccharide deacetylase family protein [Clostridium tagluense]MCB2324322.1 polysaccharide deacetylase family protein [Clostridium tagluense]MCB2329173.1 polysaccharide deacetylase family protein [Clostridium tagluense]
MLTKKPNFLIFILLLMTLINSLILANFFKSNNALATGRTNTYTKSYNKDNPILYPLGTSDKFTEKQLASNIKWKNDIVKFAKDNPDVIFLNGPTKEKIISLSFDDGPDSKITPKVLDILKKYNVKANFFFIGEGAKANPNVVKRAFNEGHLILNHSYTHADLTKLSEQGVTKELNSTDNILYTLIGKNPLIVRPPYGAIDNKVINVFRTNNYKMAIWSLDTFDWSQMEENHIVDTVINNVRPGEIILMHSNYNKIATTEALPQIIEKLQAKGYKIKTISDMLNIKAYR